MHEVSSNPDIISGATNIHAKLGTTFGIRVIAHGGSEVVQTITRVTHPPTTNPETKRTTTVDEWDARLQSGVGLYQGWGFDHDWELVPGAWRIEVLYEDHALARQDFNIRLE